MRIFPHNQLVICSLVNHFQTGCKMVGEEKDRTGGSKVPSGFFIMTVKKYPSPYLVVKSYPLASSSVACPVISACTQRLVPASMQACAIHRMFLHAPLNSYSSRESLYSTTVVIRSNRVAEGLLRNSARPELTDSPGAKCPGCRRARSGH